MSACFKYDKKMINHLFKEINLSINFPINKEDLYSIEINILFIKLSKYITLKNFLSLHSWVSKITLSGPKIFESISPEMFGSYLDKDGLNIINCEYIFLQFRV
jgi:hypothetical protein